VAYPNCAPADFAWLASGTERSVRLQPIPINPWPFLSAALVLLVVVGGWLAFQRYERAETARRTLEASRSADPLPKYLAALAAQEPRMAVDRAALVAAVGEMFSYRTWIPGWSLASAECSARLQACTRDWVRRGGSFEDLRRALPRDALEMLLPQGGTVPGLDAARTTHPARLPRVPLSLASRHTPLPTLHDALSLTGPQLQMWRTADIVLDLKQPALWPRVAELPPSFRHPRALLSGEVEMRDVPGPFILEALRTAPEFVSWEAVRVDIGQGTDVKALLKFSATGVFYAAAR